MTDLCLLRRSRLAVVALFLLFGFFIATWVVNIPIVQARDELSRPVLGGLLLLIGLGSIIGMQIASWLVGRLGTRRPLLVSLLVAAVAINTPALSRSWVGLGVSLLLIGLANGVLEVTVNDQAVLVERRYDRRIMSSFHAFYSLGAAAGAGVGSLLQGLGAGLTTSLLLGSGVIVVVGAVALPSSVNESAPSESSSSENGGGKTPWGRVALLATVGFLLMVAEGVANDWSALQAVQYLGQSTATAALAFVVVASTTTVVRFIADPVAQRFGPTAIVRWGAAVGAVGLLTVVLSPVFPLTLVGWGVFALGIGGYVPQVFSAGGNLPGANRAAMLSKIIGATYLGSLVGPAAIGGLSGLVGLTAAFLIPLCCCAVVVLLAGAVRVKPASQPTSVPEPTPLT